MPVSREQKKICTACLQKFPERFPKCPYCTGVGIGDEETEIDVSHLPSQEPDPIQKLRKFNEQHQCGACTHLNVCEPGRLSRTAMEEKWLILISDCTEFEPEEN